MGGVAEGAEIGVVRGLEAHGAAGAHQAVELLHGADHVVHVLDDVDGGEAVEGAVGEGVGETVEVGEHVGAAGGIAVDADGAGLFVDPAADVEDPQSLAMTWFQALFQSIKREIALVAA